MRFGILVSFSFLFLFCNLYQGRVHLGKMEEDERRRSVVEGTAASSSGEGAGGAPPKSGCPHAHLKSLPLRGTCNFVSILLSTGAILRLAKVRIN
jgi:hypothetical protein